MRRIPAIRSTVGALLALLFVAPLPAELPPDAEAWVRSTLESLTLRQKAAQMMGIRAFGRHYHPDSDDFRHLTHQVRDLDVGGIVIFASQVDSLPRLLNQLQQKADVPLLISADMERGIGFRIAVGPVSLPYAMAIGATGSEELARFTGRVTAREGRALGIHQALAPVVDVNVNPNNPVIHVRSYGEDPELVGRLAAAFAEGVREGGMMSTAKHFPGHGDTSTDSHFALPTVGADLKRLEAVELAPFRRLIEAGVDSIMVGHLAVPELDPSGTPATLSKILTQGLIRDRMGFSGLIVTDAMEMKGVGKTWVGAATVQAVRAGSDMILLPPDTRVAIQSVVRAVREGELEVQQINASVRRILEAKARLGLHRNRLVDLDAVHASVADPQDVAKAKETAQASITVVRNEGGVLPIRADTKLRLLHLTLASNLRNGLIDRLPEDELAARRVETERYLFGPEISAESADKIAQRAPGFSHILVSAFVRPSGFSTAQAHLLRRLNEAGPPVILTSFGSPYLLSEIPDVPVYVCAYGAAESSQRAAVGALFGEFPVHGQLPVTLPDLYPRGHGIEIPRYAMGLHRADPEEVTMSSEGLAEVDRILNQFVEQKAFPGGVLGVGHRDALVHLKPFGNLTYDDDAPAVREDTIYDLASLTKVIATTTMAMILVDEGRLDLDATVQSFLPRFQGPGKDLVTVRQLLTHSSGIDWWAPLFEKLRGPNAYVEHIQAMELAYKPGSEVKYSDLGLILLGEILERVSGQHLEPFVTERIFAPLGMVDTHYRPGAEVPDRTPPAAGPTVSRIASTERDDWRGRVVRGEVHDENAYALGGVAPHAGLFATAGDLARFVRMIVNGGVFEHHRLISRPTVEAFTRRAGVVVDSTRALGWDTRSAENSSAGTLFSPLSFGHTGFTGTSIWIDPKRELFVILLTNRVHPTRENNLIRKVRPAVADAVVRALDGSS